MHLGFQFTLGSTHVTPFGFRALDDDLYTPAAHIKQAVSSGETISFPEKQFATEREASRYAEQRVTELVDAGTLPRGGR